MKAFRIPLIGLFLLASALAGGAAGVTLMSYNVENLFDDVRNGTEFREFDPQRGHWDSELFRLRVDTLAEVIRRSIPGGPDILVLQEVENENALHALADTGLKALGYANVVFVPKKGLAANTGVLTRLEVVRVSSHHISRWNDNAVRDVVEVELRKGSSILHLFNNHWKSKTGGEKKTEASRLKAARVLNDRIREILSEDPTADIIVAGDFNENLDEFLRSRREYQTALIPLGEQVPSSYLASSIFLAVVPAEAGLRDSRLALYEPWYEYDSTERGSYVYRGSWQTLDHILLSSGLFDGKGFCYRTGGFSVFRAPFLLEPDGKPRKWTGLKGSAGFSDHLPLLMRLDARD